MILFVKIFAKIFFHLYTFSYCQISFQFFPDIYNFIYAYRNLNSKKILDLSVLLILYYNLNPTSIII